MNNELFVEITKNLNSILANTNIFFGNKINYMNQKIKKAESILKILANSRRLEILCHLTEERKSSGELTKIIGLSHSALSQHLGRMTKLNLIERTKKGQEAFYSIKSYEARAILSTLYLIYCR